GIGTDGPASNNDLDMFEEVRLASFVAKASSNDPTVVPAATALLMATRMGAQALHIGHLTGSLETGKRADLILVDTSPVHNSPRFRRDPNNAYTQLVFASKSTDVTDVMVNGKWLMRAHELLTVNEADLLKQAREVAQKIDAFLIVREQSILSKLIALGGSMEQESFEVQVKVRIKEADQLVQKLKRPEIEINAYKHYLQYDEYLLFDDPSQGRLRFREDNLISEKGDVENVRSRLTLLGQQREDEIGHDVLLSRSRFLAPALHTSRFYREYFKPAQVISIEKDRRRWHIKYKETELFVNLDQMKQPDMGYFLEIKSRTWSRKDADLKAKLVNELLILLGVGDAEGVTQDYIEILTS
ncbi:MAG TPA: amidohydrolase family protein, partial [Anaerolineales bacterium]|nr:amidohydrolase family protein [Anaerolineales bacterium]